ncbi:MAG: FAD-dependent oxidoreductase [Paracoccaceae bacterium]
MGDDWSAGISMKKQVIVIGAGIIGASIAYQLARFGATVTIIDAGGPAGQASGASFGWINASFYVNPEHFALRLAGIKAHARLARCLNIAERRKNGALCWEAKGEALDHQATALRGLGYVVEEIDAAAFATLEPNIATPPERCLSFPIERAVDPATLTAELLQAASALGARFVGGVFAGGLATRGGQVCGVETELGIFSADQVVVAAGTGTSSLLSPFGLTLKMLPRPGLLMRTRPVAPVVNHILAAPGQELRQLKDGRILAPTSASHQSDTSEVVMERPDLLAEVALTRLRALLPSVDIEWESVTLAMRPVPEDGLPVIGACGPNGTYVATMHSGVTLAAIVGELVAEELRGKDSLGSREAAMLAPFRPARFS